MSGIAIPATWAVRQSAQSRVGLYLGLVAGLCVAWYLLMPSVILRVDIPHTSYADLPIRLMALSLLVWRRSRVFLRSFWWFDMWLAIIILLPFASMLYATQTLQRNISQRDLLITLAPFISPVCIYLVFSEVRLRPGFKSTWAVAPIIALLLASCVLGLLQSRDLLGARHITEVIFNYKKIVISMFGPSAPDQARGIFNHANAFALSMSALVALAVPFLKTRKWVFILCLVMGTLGVVASQSRNGTFTFALVVGTLPWMLLLQGRKTDAVRYGLGAAAVGLVGVILLVSFGSARFRAIADRQASRSTELSRQRESLDYRAERVQIALRTAANSPLLGVGPAGSMYSPRMIVQNPLSLKGVLNSQYGLSAFQFGLAGVSAFVGLIVLLLMSVRSKTLSLERVSLGAFAVIALLAGVGENVLLQREFIGSLCLMAGIMVPRYDPGRPLETMQAADDANALG